MLLKYKGLNYSAFQDLRPALRTGGRIKGKKKENNTTEKSE